MVVENNGIIDSESKSPALGHLQTLSNPTSSTGKSEKAEKNPLWRYSSFRLRIAIALALALTIEGLMRSNINMAMVCMVNDTALAILAREGKAGVLSTTTIPPYSNISTPGAVSSIATNAIIEQRAGQDETDSDKCRNISTNPTPSNSKEMKRSRKYSGELVIPKQEQALIFTAFYAGSLFIVMPGSYLCDRFGARYLVFYGAAINVIGTFLTPMVARELGSASLVLLRFLMGCGQGILVPCMNVLIAHWFPLAEKSTAIAIATTGNQVSVVVAMFLTAELCQFEWLGGWASAFHTYGFIGIAFCAIWLYFVYDTPWKAKRISNEEVKHIYEGENMGVGSDQVDPNEVPWGRILRSLVVWSTALCSFGQNFMNVGTVVYLPSYYSSVLRMNLSSNGMMSALPFIVQLLTKILFASIADSLRVRRLMSHSAIAKMFNLTASLGAGLCFLLLSFWDCDCDCDQQRYLAISLVVLAVGLSSGFIPGYNTSIVCIAPRYTSSVASFSRLLGTIASVASPYMIGSIVVRGVRDEWKVAFWVMSFILISTGILFQLFGSASVQDWALSTTNSNKVALGTPPAITEIKEDSVAFLSAAASSSTET